MSARIAAWWSDYQPLRRLLPAAVLAEHRLASTSARSPSWARRNHLPWDAAKLCQQRQRDFNYIEMRHLWEDAGVDEAGIRLRGMHYRALVIDGPLAIPNRALPALERLIRAGRVILWGEAKLPVVGAARPRDEKELLAVLDRLATPDLAITPAHPDIRYRHVIKGGAHYYALTNEGRQPVVFRARTAAQGARALIDPYAWTEIQTDDITLQPYTTLVLRVM